MKKLSGRWQWVLVWSLGCIFWAGWGLVLQLAPLEAQETGSLPNPLESGGIWKGLLSEQKPVHISAVLVGPAEGPQAELRITATMEPDWYIYALTQPPGPATPSRIQLDPSPAYQVQTGFLPDTPPQRKQDPNLGNVVLETHPGRVTWRALVRLAEGVDRSQLLIQGRLRAQPCTATRCLAPQDFPFVARWQPGEISAELLSASPMAAAGPTELATPASPGQPGIGSAVPTSRPEAASAEPVPPEPGSPAAGSSGLSPTDLAVKIGLAFLGGLILNLMPCVLPVISLKLFSFLQQAGESRARIMALNLWYTAGLMSVFFVLAALTAALGHAWGEQFTLPWFKIALTALVFVMALSFLGVWEIPIPGFAGGSTSVRLQQQEGPAGAFFKGVFATILATPCSGPFLGALFGFLLGQSALVVFVIFGAVGLGMAMPYLVLGAFPALVQLLPKPGGWMETLKELMGFFLLGTVVFLFSTMHHRYFVPTLTLLVGLWLACWWIGRASWTNSVRSKAAAWLGGPAMAALIGWFAFSGLAYEPEQPPQDQAGLAQLAPNPSATWERIPWQPFSPDRLAQARSEGKIVLVYFTANWCLTCKWNLTSVLETAEVRQWMAEHHVVPLLADWTDQSPMIKKALNELGYNSIPVLAIWPPEPARKPIIRPDLLTKAMVLEAFKEATTASPSPP